MYVAREQQRKIGSFLFASVPSDQFVFNFHGGFGDGSAAGLRRDTPVSLGFLRQGRSTIRLLGRVHTSTAARSTAAYSGSIHLFRSPAIQGLAAEEAMATSGGGGGYEGEGAGDWEEVVLQSQSRGVLEHLNDLIQDFCTGAQIALAARNSRAVFRSSCRLLPVARPSMEMTSEVGDAKAIGGTAATNGASNNVGDGGNGGGGGGGGGGVLSRKRLIRSVSEDILGNKYGPTKTQMEWIHREKAEQPADGIHCSSEGMLSVRLRRRRQIFGFKYAQITRKIRRDCEKYPHILYTLI